MNVCPMIIQYKVQSVRWENLTVPCLTRNMGCTLPSGDLVSAVLYAREKCDVWCHHSAHVAITFSLVFFFCDLIVCGFSMFLRSAVWMASKISCLAFLKPTESMVLGSQSSEMFRLGWVSRSSPIHLRYSIKTACSSSSILLIANCEGKRMRVFCCGWVSKKSASRSNAGRKEQRVVSLSVIVSPSTYSLCFHFAIFTVSIGEDIVTEDVDGSILNAEIRDVDGGLVVIPVHLLWDSLYSAVSWEAIWR